MSDNLTFIKNKWSYQWLETNMHSMDEHWTWKTLNTNSILSQVFNADSILKSIYNIDFEWKIGKEFQLGFVSNLALVGLVYGLTHFPFLISIQFHWSSRIGSILEVLFPRSIPGLSFYYSRSFLHLFSLQFTFFIYTFTFSVHNSISSSITDFQKSI